MSDLETACRHMMWEEEQQRKEEKRKAKLAEHKQTKMAQALIDPCPADAACFCTEMIIHTAKNLSNEVQKLKKYNAVVNADSDFKIQKIECEDVDLKDYSLSDVSIFNVKAVGNVKPFIRLEFCSTKSGMSKSVYVDKIETGPLGFRTLELFTMNGKEFAELKFKEYVDDMRKRRIQNLIDELKMTGVDVSSLNI